MIEKLLNKIYSDGPERHLVNAIGALVNGNNAGTIEALASYLVVRQALEGPLNWISHPEYVNVEDVAVSESITGLVHYQGKEYKFEIFIGDLGD